MLGAVCSDRDLRQCGFCMQRHASGLACEFPPDESPQNPQVQSVDFDRSKGTRGGKGKWPGLLIFWIQRYRARVRRKRLPYKESEGNEVCFFDPTAFVPPVPTAFT